jgi:hypothetical protein
VHRHCIGSRQARSATAARPYRSSASLRFALPRSPRRSGARHGPGGAVRQGFRDVGTPALCAPPAAWNKTRRARLSVRGRGALDAQDQEARKAFRCPGIGNLLAAGADEKSDAKPASPNASRISSTRAPSRRSTPWATAQFLTSPDEGDDAPFIMRGTVPPGGVVLPYGVRAARIVA